MGFKFRKNIVSTRYGIRNLIGEFSLPGACRQFFVNKAIYETYQYGTRMYFGGTMLVAGFY